MQNFKINVTDKYSNVISQSLYNKLTSIKTTAKKEFSIAHYASEDSAFVNEFTSTINGGDKLFLLEAPQGTGKTTFLMQQITSSQDITLIVEPKKTNIMQLVSDYNAVAFTSDAIKEAESIGKYLITSKTKVVVATPELAAYAYELLTKYTGAVKYFIIDEAHDIIASIPSYRDIQGFFETLENVLNNDVTKVLFVTATPEPIEFITFDTTFKLIPEKSLFSGDMHCYFVSSTNKYISQSQALALKLSEIKSTTNAPMLCYYDSKSKIQKAMDNLSIMGYNCLSITADDKTDSVVYKSIVNNKVLPAFQNGRIVDFIFTTSTIISGISIKENEALGQYQYVPCMIIDSADKVNVANFQQFACRLRYDVPATYVMQLSNSDKTKTVLDKDAITDKIMDSLKETSIVRNFTGIACEVNYIGKTVTDFSGLFYQSGDIDQFAVATNALIERDNRLFGKKNVNALVATLRRHLNIGELQVYNCVYDNSFDRFTGINNNDKELVKASKKQARMDAVNALNCDSDLIDRTFRRMDKTVENDVITVSNGLRNEMNTLNMAYAIGGADAVKDYLSKDNQHSIAKAQFEIEKSVGLVNIGSSTILEMAISGAYKTLSVPMTSKQRAMLDSFTKTSVFKDCANLYNSTGSINEVIDVLRNSEKNYDLTKIKRRNQARHIACLLQENNIGFDFYADHDFILGQEVCLMIRLATADNQNFIYHDGFIVTREMMIDLANTFTNVIGKKYNATYTWKQIRNIFVDLFENEVIENGDVRINGTSVIAKLM